LLNRLYSHIYIEKAARGAPEIDKLLARFSDATVIEIETYQQIFNRSRQNFRAQKASPALILAKKRDGLLYRGSDVAPDFGQENFYYNALILNCLYDCSYCYLQGMYNSANTVIFVNKEDFFQAVKEELKIKKSLYLCVSYDSDLLAFETLIPYSRQWIEFADATPGLLIELRTKSANFKSISDLKPSESVVLAWTLSPASVVERHEAKTPSLTARLRAARQAIERGWKIRLCFDPVLRVKDWDKVYPEFIGQVFSQLPVAGIRDVSLGVFRINSQYFKRLRNVRIESEIISYPFERAGQIFTYSKKEQEEMLERLSAETARYLPNEKIVLCL
jgi:spore photoproduct lyase